jgi:uncharacterized membrane protein
MVVLAVALLMPAQGIMAGEKEMMKELEDVDQKVQKVMKMMKEKKMKMTPDQEKAMMQKFDDFEKYLDSLLKQAG